MKLIIQIPCLNEEKTLPIALKSLPKSIPGISKIEIQIINDGSTDRTVEVARQHGVHHIVNFKHNRGLAAAFAAGIDNALRNGADILVNTDADAQYKGECIRDLIKPIVEGKADMTVGARNIDGHLEFSWVKKRLQKIGSWVLRTVSGTRVLDAASGFRAYNRFSLMRINIYSHFSYTLETLIQAGYQNLKVESVPIEVNPKTRESRLFKNVLHYLWNSSWTVINIFLIYKSSFTLKILSFISLLGATGLATRYLWLLTFEHASKTAFWPSLMLSASLLILSLQFYLAGLQSLLTSSNRKLLEEVVCRLRDSDTRHRDTTAERRAA